MLKEERKKRKEKDLKEGQQVQMLREEIKHEAANHLTWLESQVCTGNRGQ